MLAAFLPNKSRSSGEVNTVAFLQEEDADKEQQAAKALRNKNRRQAKAAIASAAAAAAAAPGPSGADAAHLAEMVQPGAASPVSALSAAADAAQQPDSTAASPAAEGQAAGAHAWQLCPLTKVLFAASARHDSDVRHSTWLVYAHHLFGVTRHGGNASSRLLSARRSWQSAQTLSGPNPKPSVVCTSRWS